MVKPILTNPIIQIEEQTLRPNKVLSEKSTSFSDVLSEKAQGLTFSKHAQNRLENRQINLGDEGIARLEQAVQKAEKRGAQESLILMDDVAFIVNVPDRRVVTALDASKRGEGVFTNIDSVVLADSINQDVEKG